MFGLDQNEELDALVDVVERVTKCAGIIASQRIRKIEYMIFRIFGKANMMIAASA
ncbi:hypothetical protein IFT37_22475 [Pseudomonas fluorescens]|nr:hypothetical protein [Pseudomonas fluorescens]MBD8178596.1 hypothetical protein [Pseudomonas fluorescens]MBD8747871.1 hypothetical protein [Pseudomonas fluorescens]MBD8751946.1 hypothetical protein [Pseudomonas fluorescens]MBD8761366.1 hypothetical protein [Pseudomonas fluorescens]